MTRFRKRWCHLRLKTRTHVFTTTRLGLSLAPSFHSFIISPDSTLSRLPSSLFSRLLCWGLLRNYPSSIVAKARLAHHPTLYSTSIAETIQWPITVGPHLSPSRPLMTALRCHQGVTHPRPLLVPLAWFKHPNHPRHPARIRSSYAVLTLRGTSDSIVKPLIFETARLNTNSSIPFRSSRSTSRF